MIVTPRARIAVVSMHTSPTASLGESANGGMNVYIREICAAFSRTRAWCYAITSLTASARAFSQSSVTCASSSSARCQLGSAS